MPLSRARIELSIQNSSSYSISIVLPYYADSYNYCRKKILYPISLFFLYRNFYFIFHFFNSKILIDLMTDNFIF